MTIGTDDKLLNARSTNKKRIKSGAKGIGRFALNRLGTSAEMMSFVGDDSGKGLLWNVDWNKFDQARVLSDVNANLEEISTTDMFNKLKEYGLDRLPIYDKIFIEKFSGTILCISDLNDIWNHDSLNSLLKNLEMLIPAQLQTSFKMYLYSMENIKWCGHIVPMEYEDYDYKISAEYNGGRKIQVKLERNELNIPKLETLYNKLFLRNSMKVYPFRLDDFRNRVIVQTISIPDKVDSDLLEQVGRFEFTFFFLKNTIKDDRDKDGNQKYPYNLFDEASRINWLDKFGGVRIYRDEFRVRPYGENGDDWLGLGRRQAKSPGGAGQKIGGYRIRPNQIAGSVKISRLTNMAFEDKSSREGIQENEAFALFKNILIGVINYFENDRNTIMYNLSELFKEEHPQTNHAREIVRIALKSNDVKSEGSENLKILAESYQSLETELKDKEAELSMLRGLASMGISLATFTHELRGIMLRLLPRNEMLKEILMRYLPVQKFEGIRFENPYRELENMKQEDEKLSHWISYSLKSIRRSKREWSNIDLSLYFNNFVETWRPSLSLKNIDISLSIIGMEGATIDAFEMDLDSIFNNYITNSISAFLTSKELKKLIRLNIANNHGYAIIDFMDNGIGLAKQYCDNPEVIFNAFETSIVDNKNNKIGTGMGLFIAKGVISKYPDAMIALLPVEKGFSIRTIFKIK